MPCQCARCPEPAKWLASLLWQEEASAQWACAVRLDEVASTILRNAGQPWHRSPDAPGARQSLMTLALWPGSQEEKERHNPKTVPC